MLNPEEDCEALQRAFGVLKPVCDDVVKSVTKTNAQALRNLLQNVHRPALQKLQSYVLFPIEGNLSVEQTVSNEIKRYLVESLTELLSLTRTTSFDTFLRLYRLLFLQITDFRNCQHTSAKSENLSPTTKIADVSEELKMSVLQCVIVLFSTATSEVVDRFYDSKFYPTIAWGILLCTKIVHHEKMIKLRVEALNCILHQSQCHDEADVTDIVFRDKVRNALMHMLPGIVSTSAFAVRNPIENHRIVQMAIRVWSRIVVLVMVDDEEQNYNNAFHIGKHFVALDQLILDKNKLQNGKRSLAEISEDPQKVSDNSVTSKTKELQNKAALNLAEISKVMVSTEQHNHWHVRKELAVAVDQILTNCSKIMEPSISSLIECLIILSQDESENVSNYSMTALKKFSEKYESDSEKSFLESIEESFFTFLTRFPRVVLSSGAATQMGLLNGYLHLFGSQLPLVLSSKTHLHRLMFCLINSIQFDVSNISLLSGPSLRDMDDENAYGNLQWKKMILSQDDQVLIQLHQICIALRNNADLSVICHTLMDLRDEYQQYVNELLLILNSLLTSGCDESMTKYKSLMKELLDFYMELPVWPASDLLIETKSSLRSDQIRVVQLCLAIEGIGRIAVVVGKEIFDPWLLQCLYSILEAAGSPLEVISLAGLDAIRNIGKVCANNDLTTLICNNTDYLTHHITKRMRHYHRHPGLLAVLSVIMHYSSKEVLPSLHEIISDVLQQSYDTFQMNNMYAYLRTFFTFIASIRRWEVEVEFAEKLDKKSELLSDEKTPLEQLLDYKKSKTVAENLDTDSESDEEKTLEERFSKLKKSCKDEIIGENDDTLELEKVNDEKKKVVPLHIQLVVDILQRSLHFLPSKDCTQRILVLQVLNEGVLLLKTCPDQLLPVVHSIWSPLINRFQRESNEPLAMQRAFQLLQSLAATSRDFIRVRTLRDVLPSVCKVLKSTAAESILKDTKSAYRLTQQYKLQKCLLEGLGQLAVDIEVSECNMDEILKAATPYLNSLQPQPLQDACILLFKTLMTVSFDFVWLHLISVWSPVSLIKSDCPFLLTVQLPVSIDSEYKKNIQILLQFCDSLQMTT